MGIFGKKSVSAPVQDTPVPKADLVSLRKEAKVSLTKHGLNVDGTGGIAVYLVLDHSASMRGYYRDGDVQRITDQVFALTLEIDADGKVPVFYYGWDTSEPETVTRDNYAGFVDRTHRNHSWGSTNTAGAIWAVAAYHAQHGGGEPGLVVLQTDGVPDSRQHARQALLDVSGDKLFFAFVGYGPRRNVDFLFELDQIAGRVRDNASAFHALDPQRTKDSDLYDGVLGEFTSEWLPQVL
jgi:hypothetical protein